MPNTLPLSALEQRDEFIARHIGPCPTEIAAMLATMGTDSLVSTTHLRGQHWRGLSHCFL